MLLVIIILIGVFPIVINTQCVKSNIVTEVKQAFSNNLLRITIINCSDETEEIYFWET